jgi:plastocyanin
MLAYARRLLVVVVLALVANSLSAATVGVTVSNFKFSPNNLTINAGDTVTFSNISGSHNVLADDNSFTSGPVAGSPWSFSQTFNSAGTFRYYCVAHGAPGGVGMSGVITVNATTPTINLGGYMSGAWYHPGQAGHGFDLELTTAPGSTATTKTMVAFWYVYMPDGSAQNWVYAQGDYDPTMSTVTLPATLYTGGRFPPNFNQADVTSLPFPPGWGTLTFSFSDCNNGTVSWHSDLPGYNMDNDSPLTIARLTQIDGTTCPQ